MTVSSIHLFSPLKIRDVTFRNRIGVSPMCQYSSNDGYSSDWHMVHLGSRAVGGAGLVMAEATAVTPEGRITPHCLGLWKDAHVDGLRKITGFIKKQGAVAGIQLAHAGRKASMQKPSEGGKYLSERDGGWTPFAPSPLPFAADHAAPLEMLEADIQKLIEAFVKAGLRAVKAGFQVIEIHAAHGYLLHEFLSPLSNRRADQYGGAFENRARLLLDIAEQMQGVLPRDIVLAARLSCRDWAAGGVTLEESILLSSELKKRGVDLIDCSSGFVVPDEQIPFAPGFQVPFAREIREKSTVLTAAVGMITDPKQADEIIRGGSADIVLLGREMLRNPYWPLHAAQALGVKIDPAEQYLRAY